jgi:hypothetical protein
VTERIEFGIDGLYVLRSSPDDASGPPVENIERYDAGAPATPVRLFDGAGRFRLQQIVPTATGTFVVATALGRPGHGPFPASGTGLYRLVAGRLALVRPVSVPATLTAVSPLAGA